jgi:elongation factor P
VIEKEMEFLYNDADNYYFMDSANYEQDSHHTRTRSATHPLPQANTKVMILTHDEKPIGVSLPTTMTLTDHRNRAAHEGRHSRRRSQAPKLDNGLTIKVPQFIEEGTLVRVNTETNEYVDRA